MQRTLLSALLATVVACSSSTASTHPDTGSWPSGSSPHPTRQAEVDGESSVERMDDEGLLGIDLSSPQTGQVSVLSSIDGGVVDTEDAHDHGGEFLGPLVWPDPPLSGAHPLEHVAWLGTVLLNTHAGQPFDSSVFEGLVADPLVSEFDGASVPSETRQDVDHRAVLIDSWVIGSTATSTRVEAVAVFERTSGTGDVQLAGIEFVYIDVTLALDLSSTWVAVELLVSS